MRRVVSRPLDDSGDVARCFWVAGVRRQAIAGVDAKDAMPREIVEDIGIDLGAAMAAALGERATMDKDQGGLRRAPGVGRVEHLERLSFMWAKMAKAAQGHVAAGDTDPFYANKLITAQYFVDRVAPEGSAHLAKLKAGAAGMMALPADAF